ncbi:hypothetical protein VP01_13611g1 [Puccinia sorghi]|uniref:OTU domain-containing protein n=1 Tax=Puccinia sorghi TaxID=27349 RepID=A0A0L6VM29_9BASI|nr:hypothetical protein VP01_13611g1 [Puccinia sorghi]
MTADGHCGYLAIGECLGRGQEAYMKVQKNLYAEINKNHCGKKNRLRR